MVRYCHLYNRGVDKRTIFLDDSDRQRFIEASRLARLSNSPKLSWLRRQVKIGNLSPSELEKLEEKYGPPLIDITAYSLMPSHFHFQVKELVENGVTRFFRKLGTSYAMYFNAKHERTGCLFESRYRSVLIETDEQLIHLSRYIHLNPVNSSKLNVSFDDLKTYPWTSLPDFLGVRQQSFCDPTEVMNFFPTHSKYWRFLKGAVIKEVLSVTQFLDA